MRKKMLFVEFIDFPKNSNWCSGRVDQFWFEAKLFDEPSDFGIKKGRVSKLQVWFPSPKDLSFEKEIVINYDRGWDIRPSEDAKSYFEAIMSFLEKAPKRFE